MKRVTVLSIAVIAILVAALATSIIVGKPFDAPNDQVAVNDTDTPIVTVAPIEEVTPSPAATSNPVTAYGPDLPVTVSGSISTANYWQVYTDINYNPTYIRFLDKQTGQLYVANISGTSFTVELLNQHVYDVRGYWNGTSTVSQAQDFAVSSDGSLFAHDLVFPKFN